LWNGSLTWVSEEPLSNHKEHNSKLTIYDPALLEEMVPSPATYMELQKGSK